MEHAGKKTAENKTNGPQETPDQGARSALDRLDEHSFQSLESQNQQQYGEGGKAGAGLARLASMGFEFFGVLLIFGLIGHWLDDQFGWHGIATITALLVAFIGEMYLQIKAILRKNKK